ncbi:MAG TPA: TetR/AcrR family transcriptional regulator [Nocardioides sp.]|nr:TetR/AcrR family transcriptional regulator [Nocardioides sp.]
MSTIAEARRYGGQSAAERDEERRARLRRAALDLFSATGYANVSVDRLCGEAKVSTRHFYQLFSTKEDMLVDLYEMLMASSLEDVGESLARTQGESIQVRLTDAIGAYLRPMLEDPRKGRIAFVEIVGVSVRMEERRLEFRAGLLSLIEAEAAAAVERGELPAGLDFRLRALAIVGAANVIVHDWSIHGSQAAAPALARDFCALALEILVGSRD